MEIVRAEVGSAAGRLHHRHAHRGDRSGRLGPTDRRGSPRADPALFDARAADKWHVRVPGGENYAEVAARATDWVTGLSTDTFAVSHGALTRVLRGLFLDLDWQGMSALDEPQGVVFRVRDAEVARLD